MFFFFFNFNDEKKLGFKKLSKSDLGLGTSHQTHIGLYEDVFTFLGDSDVVRTAMLIYDKYCEILDCSFDRIQNPNGSFRSPKIKVGQDPENSVVTKIREFAAQSPNSDWYLLWSGLESEELTFWLVKGDSTDFKTISRILPEANKVYSEVDGCYSKALDAFTKKVNEVSTGVQKEIETASQIGDLRNRYKKSDVEKAERLFKEIGQKGEHLVAEYLSKQKAGGVITSFDWMNQSRESGLPFDFIINGSSFVDVKSTSFDFEQYVYFSNQEVEFASKQKDNYSVYRVFGMRDSEAYMKVCKQGFPYLSSIEEHIRQFSIDMTNKDAMLQTVKLGILPKVCFSSISNTPINLL